jgi:hypothetical protein
MVATPSSKIGSIGVDPDAHKHEGRCSTRMGVEVTFVEAPEGGHENRRKSPYSASL